MKCSECGDDIKFYEEDVTVFVVYADGRGCERHCHHNPFNESDFAITAILGSRDCLARWQQGTNQTTRGN